jgi:rhodanese-related sulfurtransferase
MCGCTLGADDMAQRAESLRCHAVTTSQHKDSSNKSKMLSLLTLATIMLALSTGSSFTANSHFSLGRGANPRSAGIQAQVRLRAHPEHILQLCNDIGVGGKTLLLDVRELDEWTDGHLADACPAPLSALLAGTWMDSSTGKFYPGTFPIDPFTGVAILRNAKIYVHSATGLRASEAADLLKKMGYSNVVLLAEGFKELATMEVSSVVTGGPNALTD